MASLWKSSQRGFTGIEVLIVLTVLAIVAILVVNNIQESLARGRDIERRTDINEIQDRLENYWHANEFYPVDLTELGLTEALVGDPSGNQILMAAASESGNRPDSGYSVEQPEQEYTYAPFDCGPETIETDTQNTATDDQTEESPETDPNNEAAPTPRTVCRQYVLYSWLEQAEELEIPYSKGNLHNAN